MSPAMPHTARSHAAAGCPEERAHAQAAGIGVTARPAFRPRDLGWA
jgi:hypothetical protein